MLITPGSTRQRLIADYTFVTLVLWTDRPSHAPARYPGGTGRPSDLLGVTQPGSDIDRSQSSSV